MDEPVDLDRIHEEILETEKYLQRHRDGRSQDNTSKVSSRRGFSGIAITPNKSSYAKKRVGSPAVSSPSSGSRSSPGLATGRTSPNISNKRDLYDNKYSPNTNKKDDSSISSKASPNRAKTPSKNLYSTDLKPKSPKNQDSSPENNESTGSKSAGIAMTDRGSRYPTLPQRSVSNRRPNNISMRNNRTKAIYDESDKVIDEESNGDNMNTESEGAAKSRYSNPMDREVLINRLLAMAENKSALNTTSSSSSRSKDHQSIKSNSDESSNKQIYGDSDELFFASDLPGNDLNATNQNVYPFDDLSYSNIMPSKSLITSSVGNLEKNPRPASAPPRESIDENKDIEMPKTRSSTSNRHRSASPFSRVASLGEKKYLKSKSDLHREAEEKFQKTYVFRPQIQSKSSFDGRQRSLPFASNQSVDPTDYAYGYSRKDSKIRDRIDEMLYHYERSLKRREIRRREEQNFELLECTFTPSITKKAEELAQKKRRDSSSSHMDDTTQRDLTGSSGMNASKDISIRLHEDAIKRIEQQKWLTKHVEDARSLQYTFHPAINPRGRSTEKSPIRHRTPSPSTSRKSRVQALFQRYSEANDEDARQIYASSAMARNLSPNIHRPIYERVAELQKEKSRRMQELMSEIEEKNSHEMTFKPQINKQSQILAHQRLSKSINSIQEELLKDRQYYQGTSDENIRSVSPGRRHQSIYRPVIIMNDKIKSNETKSEDEKKNNEEDVDSEAEDILMKPIDIGTRLHLHGRRQAKHLLRLQQEYEDLEYQRIQASKFKPTSLTPTSFRDKISHECGEQRDMQSLDFHERQKLYLHRIKSKHAKQIEQRDREAQSWFHPKLISKSEELLLERHPERVFETSEDRIHRLTEKHLQSKKQAEDAVLETVTRENTFQPQLNSVTMSLTNHRTENRQDGWWDELYENNKGKKVKELTNQRIRNKLSQEYSFKPKTTKYYDKMIASNVRDSFTSSHKDHDEYHHVGYMECPVDNAYNKQDSPPVTRSQPFINFKQPEKMKQAINSYLLQKNSAITSNLLAKELNELKDCTFSPEIIGLDYKYQLSTEPVIVRGLGRHLQLRDMSTRIKDENLRREQEVFRVKNIEKYRRPEDGRTIIEPFNLSESFSKSDFKYSKYG